MGNPRYRLQLRQKLDESFDIVELRTLCFDLGVDFENLPGRTKMEKGLELIAFMERTKRIDTLISFCRERRPNSIWSYQARLFISYKQHADIDQSLAYYLHQSLKDQGHKVFIDQALRTGTDWLAEIDRQLKAADFLVVLLSKESANSEMVQSEVRRAYQYRQQQGYPEILPVRIAYEDILPYTIDAFLNPLQYVVWQNASDNERVGQEISAAVNGHLPDQLAISPTSGEDDFVSEDGRLIVEETKLPAPLPEFDPRLLQELAPPGGTVRLRDKFYIEREADTRLKRQILRSGSITTIRAPRQTGKSSLLIRGLQHARQNNVKTIYLDLQRTNREYLTTIDSFMRYLANFLGRQLGVDPNEIDKTWEGFLGSQDKLTYLMEDKILPSTETRIVLAIDEADRLLETNFHTDFFGLIRAWHNNAAYDQLWEQLSIVLIISTEPYLLIADSNQSPFNVGEKLYLQDFDEFQVATLNQRHNSPVQPQDLPQFFTLINGHPYLTRKALYTLVTTNISWTEFLEQAPTDQGPFSDHLRHQLALLHHEPELWNTLKQIVRHNRCGDDSHRFRLLRAGLINASGDYCTCRCDLYQRYFTEKL